MKEIQTNHNAPERNDIGSSKRKLFLDSLLYMIGDFMVIGVCGFLLIPVYVKNMSPSEYGILGSVLTLITLLGVILMLGLHSAFGRYYFIFRSSNEENKYLTNIYVFQTFFSIIVSVVLLFFGKYLLLLIAPEIPHYPYLYLIVLGGFLAFSSGIYSIFLRVREKAFKFIIFQSLSTFIYIVLIYIFLIIKQKGAIGVIWATIIANIIIAIFSLWLLRSNISFDFNKRYLSGSLNFGSWMMLATLSSIVLNRSQLFFLQNYTNLSLVGIFNLGLQLSGVIPIVSVSFAKAWQPFIYSSTNREVAKINIERTSKYYLVLMTFTSLGIYIFSHEIIAVLANESYSETGKILRVLSIAMLFNSISLLPSSAMLYEEKAKVTQLITMVSVVWNLVLSFILVRFWGIYGAALSMLFSSVLLLLLSFYFGQKILKIDYPYYKFFMVILSGISIIVFNSIVEICFLFPYITIIKIVLILTYPLLLVTTQVFSIEEVSKFISKIKENSGKAFNGLR